MRTIRNRKPEMSNPQSLIPNPSSRRGMLLLMVLARWPVRADRRGVRDALGPGPAEPGPAANGPDRNDG